MVLLLLGIPFRRTHTLVVGLGPDGDKGLRTQGDARGPLSLSLWRCSQGCAGLRSLRTGVLIWTSPVCVPRIYAGILMSYRHLVQLQHRWS
jgi:hypothetical protein